LVGAPLLDTKKHHKEHIEELIDIIHKYKPSVVYSVPETISNIINSGLKYDFSFIRCWDVAGFDVNYEDAIRFDKTLINGKFSQHCARTESFLLFGCELTDSLEKRAGTIGKELFPNSTRIVNGELQIRKEWVMTRLDEPHKFTKDGWYATWDLVEKDKDGYIKIIGRKQE